MYWNQLSYECTILIKPADALFNLPLYMYVCQMKQVVLFMDIYIICALAALIHIDGVFSIILYALGPICTGFSFEGNQQSIFR